MWRNGRSEADASGTTRPAQIWDRKAEWPLAFAALAFLVAYAWEVLERPVGVARIFVNTVILATWVVFAVDYLIRLVLAERRVRWFIRHLPDLAIVALPMLRPLRLLRLINLLAILHRTAGSALRGRLILYVISATTVLIGVSGLAMLAAERDAGGDISTYGDALWWAITTITTVGYGDLYPVTLTGRLIAAALMISGIALLGLITATLASWLVQQISEQDESSQMATRAQVRALTDEVRELRRLMERNPSFGPPVDDT